MPSQSNDQLWRNLMRCCQKKFPHIRSHWKETSNSSSNCELCQEVGGGCLIKCSHEKCKKEFHIDCAFQLDGLMLEDGLLSFSCDQHFKPILFCKCLQKYDETQPMIFCDECCEWYHLNCVGVLPDVASNLENYTCPQCKTLMKERKQISPVLKEKNQQKEVRCSQNLEALKSIGHLVEISAVVAPLLDQLSQPRTTDPMIKFKEGLEFLKKSRFLDPNDTEIEKFDMSPLLAEWQEQLERFVNLSDRWFPITRRWLSDLKPILQSCSISLPTGKSLPQVFPTPLIERMKNMEKLRIEDGEGGGEGEEGQKGFPCPTSTECDSFQEAVEGVNWTSQFLQMVYTPLPDTHRGETPQASAAQWLAALQAHLRLVPLRVRKINALVKELGPTASHAGREGLRSGADEEVLGGWTTGMLEIFRQASSLYNLISDHVKRIVSALDGKGEWAGENKLQSLISLTQDVPILPILSQALSSRLDLFLSLESRITSFLSSSFSGSANEINPLINQAEELRLSGPVFDELLRTQSASTALSQLRDLSEQQGRIDIEKLQLNLELAESISPILSEGEERDNEEESKSRARREIEQQVREASDKLLMMELEIRSLQSDAAEMLASGIYVESSLLTELRKSQIVTQEERVMDMLLDSESLLSSLEGLFTGPRPVDPAISSSLSSDSSKILEKYNASFYSNEKISRDRLEALRTHRSSLLKEEFASKRIWEEAQSFIRDCRAERAGSFEQLSTIISRTLDAFLPNPQVTQQLHDLRTQAEAANEQCQAALLKARTESPSQGKSTLESVKALFSSLPISESSTHKFKSLLSVFTLLSECSDILSLHTHQGQIFNSSKESRTDSEKMIGRVQRLRKRLRDSLQSTSESSERDLIQSTLEPFELFVWKAEAEFALLQRVSIIDAKEILSLADSLPQSSLNDSSFRKFKESLETSIRLTESFQSECEDGYLSKYDEAKSMTNKKLSGARPRNPPVDPITGELTFSQDSLPLTTALQIWNEIINPISQTLPSLMKKGSALPLSLSDLSDRLVDFQSAITLLSQSTHYLSLLQQSYQSLPPISTESERVSASRSDSQVLVMENLATWSELSSNLKNKEPDFLLLRELSQDLQSIFQEVVRWNDANQNFLPLKTIRTKVSSTMKRKAHTVSDLEAILCEPISRLVRMQCHERMVDTLKEVDSYRSELGRLLLKPREKKDKEAPSPDIVDEMNAEMKPFTQLQSKFELVPLDLPELALTTWVLSVMDWFLTYVDSEGLRFTPHSISFSTAMDNVSTASGLLDSLDSSLRSCLFHFKVLDTWNPPSSDLLSAHLLPHTHKYIRRFVLLFEKLNSEFEKTRLFQQKLEDTIEMAEDPRSAFLASSEEFKSLIVQPTPSSKKFIGKLFSKGETIDFLSLIRNDTEYWAIERSPRGERAPSSSTQRRERSDKHRDDDYEYEDEGEDDEDWKIRKRGRTEHGESTRKSADKATEKQHKKPSTPTSASSSSNSSLKRGPRVCCSPKCNSDLRSSQFMSCSEKCAFHSVTDYYEALMTVRAHLITPPLHPGPASHSTINLSGVSLEKDRLAMRSMGLTISDSINSTEKVFSEKNFLHHTELESKDLNLYIKKALKENSLRKNSKSSTGFHSDRCSASSAFYAEILSSEAGLDLRPFLSASLQRQGVFGAGAYGSFFGLEIERELQAKYSTVGEYDSKKLETLKKDLKKHHLMLYRNLRQPHNDELILKISRGQVSVLDLLKMTPQQFADAETQKIREKESKQTISTLSYQDELEARRKTAMEGMDSWRDGDETFNESVRQLIASQSAPLPKNPEGLTKVKDPFVDVGLRSVTGRSSKPWIDSIEDHSPVSPSENSPTPSPRQHSNPLTEFMKLQSRDKPVIPQIKESLKTPEIPPHHEDEPLTHSTMQLISSTWGSTFQIQRPNSRSFSCQGVVTDRRTQGLLTSIMNIDGRVPINNLEIYLNQTIAQGRKLTATARMYVDVSDLSPDSGYFQFCKEFTTYNRSGICNVSQNIQLYLVPPFLKDAITLLRSFPPIDEAAGQLFGIIISREEGPSEFVRSPPKYIDESVHFVPPSVSPLAESSPLLSVPPSYNTWSSSISEEFSPTTEPPTPPSPSPATTESQEALELSRKIRTVAEFCAKKGAHAIKLLREQENARINTPFLFEGCLGNSEFVETLKGLLGFNKK